MDFNEINSFLAPAGLVIAGLIMKFSNNTEMFGTLKKRWLFFVIGGSILLSIRIFEHLK